MTIGFPDRIELRDAEPGERLILVNYVHQPADTPYRASHAVFVLEGDVCDGRELGCAIRKLLANSEVAYLHAHYAKPGCYAARIERSP